MLENLDEKLEEILIQSMVEERINQEKEQITKSTETTTKVIRPIFLDEEDEEVEQEFLIKEIGSRNSKNENVFTDLIKNFNFNDPLNYRKQVPRYRELKEVLKTDESLYSLDYINMFRLYDGLPMKKINEGDVINGVISMISTKEVMVNISNKDNVIIDRKGNEDKICNQLTVGKNVDIIITKISDKPYFIKGSIEQLIKFKVEQKMKQFFEENTSIPAYVREIIPAGFLLEIEIDGINIDAFMPNTLADVNKLYDVNTLLGTTIHVMLETLQQDKGIYVVSRKKYLQTLIPEKIKQIRKLPKDKVYTGRITGTRDFGIFIQFEDCLTGMIHKANLREELRGEILNIQPGTLIEFYIKDIIKGGSQIILTQYLQESIWDTIRVSDKFKGKVITVKPFGALIELDYETNGLIQTTYINKNERKLKDGDIVDVIVISIIRDDRKIYLTFANDEDTLNKLKEKSDDLERLKQKFNSNN